MSNKNKKAKIDWTSLLIQSILDLAVGLILLYIMLVKLGIFFIAIGIAKFIYAMYLKRKGE